MKDFEIKELVKETVVTSDKLACAVGSGSLRVYATPMAAALIEQAASELAQEYVDDGCTTVGTKICIEHISPTPVNAAVWAKAELVSADGRLFLFNVTAYDKAGVIAHGTHERVSVRSVGFQKKADGKFDL